MRGCACRQPVLTVTPRSPQAAYWIHIWACDFLANCGMTRSYPILVDLTPPDSQITIIP